MSTIALLGSLFILLKTKSTKLDNSTREERRQGEEKSWLSAMASNNSNTSHHQTSWARKEEETTEELHRLENHSSIAPRAFRRGSKHSLRHRRANLPGLKVSRVNRAKIHRRFKVRNSWVNRASNTRVNRARAHRKCKVNRSWIRNNLTWTIIKNSMPHPVKLLYAQMRVFRLPESCRRKKRSVLSKRTTIPMWCLLFT